MKVAVCLYGQMRTFNNSFVINSNKRYLFDKINPDIFISTWKNIGSSIHYDEPNIEDFIIRESKKNDDLNLNDIYSIYKPKKVNIINYNEWFDSLNTDVQLAINEKDGTSVPCLYQMYMSSLLKQTYENENKFIYDFVIVMRPDMVFWNELDQQYLIDQSAVFHPNVSPDYYPNIFNNTIFVSNSKISDIICSCYLEMFNFTGDKYPSEVSRMNVLKILFNYLKHKNIKMLPFNKSIAYVLKENNSIPLIEKFYKCKINL